MNVLLVLPCWHGDPKTKAYEHACWLSGALAPRHAVDLAAVGDTRPSAGAGFRRPMRFLPADDPPGPSEFSSAPLIRFLQRGAERFDAVLFYSYADPAALRLAAVTEKSLLVPSFTAVNGPLDRFAELVELASGVIYQSAQEKELVESRLGRQRRSAVFEIAPRIAPPPDGEALRRRNGLTAPVIGYPGTVSLQRDCDELFAEWAALRDRPRTSFRTLLLGGRVETPIPDRPDIVSLPAPDDAARHASIAAADVIVDPARSDGSDLILLESFALSKPVLVHRDNSVAAARIRESQGGLVYESTETFVQSINQLVAEGATFGAAGRRSLPIPPRSGADVGSSIRELLRRVPEPEDGSACR